MNKTPGPTPEWFGKPQEPRVPPSSAGANIVTIVATFAVTIVLCGFVGFALYGVAERKSKVAAAMRSAQQAADDRQTEMMLERAHRDCEKEVARARADCSEPLVRSDNADAGATATPAEEAFAVIRASHGQFRACFNEVLRTSPDAQGKVNLQLIVAPTGHVRDVKLIGSTLPESMNDCLARTARLLRFPANFEETTIRVPLTFVAQ